MLQVQSPAIPAPSFVDVCGPRYHLISSHRAFANFPTTPRTCKLAAEYLQTGEDSTSEGTLAYHEHAAELLRLYHRMKGPMDIPQRKPICEVLSEYQRQLSRKKNAVLALAAVQVECEESEAVIFEAFGLGQLKEIHQGFYVTDNPKSATGRYFDFVSSARYDPLGE